jgi:hypothetical protein
MRVFEAAHLAPRLLETVVPAIVYAASEPHVPFGPSNFSGGVNLEIILAALVAQVSGLTRLVHPKLHSGFADFVVRYLALSGFRTADHTERFSHLNDPGTAAQPLPFKDKKTARV